MGDYGADNARTAGRGPSLLEQLTQRAHQAIGTVESIVERGHQDLDKLLGTSPVAQPMADKPGPTQAGGMYGELETMVQRLEKAAMSAEQYLSRALHLTA